MTVQHIWTVTGVQYNKYNRVIQIIAIKTTRNVVHDWPFNSGITCEWPLSGSGDAVAPRVERWTSGREVAGSTPPHALLRTNLRQAVHTLVSLSPSSISWYCCKNREGNGKLWKRCGLPSITLSVSSLQAQDHGNRDECLYVTWAVRGRRSLMGDSTLHFTVRFRYNTVTATIAVHYRLCRDETNVLISIRNDKLCQRHQIDTRQIEYSLTL